MRPSLNLTVRLLLGLVAGLITTALLPTGIGVWAVSEVSSAAPVYSYDPPAAVTTSPTELRVAETRSFDVAADMRRLPALAPASALAALALDTAKKVEYLLPVTGARS